MYSGTSDKGPSEITVSVNNRGSVLIHLNGKLRTIVYPYKLSDQDRSLND